MSVSSSLAAEDRREALRALLRESGSLEIYDAAKKLGVHAMTIRRDFDFLEHEGTARRVRGAAIFVGADDFEQRQGRELAAKRQITQKLLSLLPEHTAIGLDASTTIYQFASAIPRGNQLAVVTNGMSTFDALQHKPGVRVYLTGGEAEEQNASLVGPLAVYAMSRFLLARCFLSTTSLDPTVGTSEITLAEVEVKRAMVDASQHVVLAADSTKLGTRSLVRALAMSRIHLLVTELEPTDSRLDPYRDSVEIL